MNDLALVVAWYLDHPWTTFGLYLLMAALKGILSGLAGALTQGIKEARKTPPKPVNRSMH